jgi:Sulfotransferase family
MSFSSQFDAFHEQAAKATGFDDFGAADYIEPMRLILSDYDKYSHFSEAGVQMMSAGIVGLLIGRLFSEQGFKEHPDFANAPLKKPVIIVSMLRTGSTALHRLLAKDPANQWLPPWLGATPMPRPPRETWESNPWYQMLAQGLEQIYQLNPKIKAAHPMLPTEPDECRFAGDQSFWSPGLACTAVAPEYAAWCIGSDARYSYRRYRQTLGLIAGGDTRRWVLKDPQHLWSLAAMLDVFPDACVVYCHRELNTSYASMASLIYELRRLRESDLTAKQHGRQELTLWGAAQSKAEDARNKHDPSRFCDVHIRELHADPIGTAERIYRHFNLPVSEEARQSWRTHVAMDVRAGHGAHHYKIEDFGFTEKDIIASVGSYYERYQRLYGSAV